MAKKRENANDKMMKWLDGLGKITTEENTPKISESHCEVYSSIAIEAAKLKSGMGSIIINNMVDELLELHCAHCDLWRYNECGDCGVKKETLEIVENNIKRFNKEE